MDKDQRGYNDSNMQQQISSLQDFVASAVHDLKAIANAGNSIAGEWMGRIEAAQTAHQKIYLFGEMRLLLMRDTRPEAIAVMERMYPGGREDG